MITQADARYLDDLTIRLRLAEVPGPDIGGVLEEVRSHLEESGETAAEAFGPVEDYARALLVAHAGVVRPRSGLGRAQLVSVALQLAAWTVLVPAVVALGGDRGVAIGPGRLVALVVLVGGFAWPVWPALEAHLTRRVGVQVPIVAMAATVGASVVPAVLWQQPTLVTVPAVAAIVVAAAVIAGCWWHALRQRDPVVRPSTRVNG